MILNALPSIVYYRCYLFSVLTLLFLAGNGIDAKGRYLDPPDKPQLKFKQFLNGLSQSHALCIVQDSLGFIWVGTYNGLNRFDGVNFQVYEANDNDSTSLPDNRIYDLLIDQENNLWIATNGAVARYDYQTNSFVRYQFADEQQGVIVTRSLLSKSNGMIWAGTHRGLYELDEAGLQFTKVGNLDLSSLKSQVINKLYEDRLRQVWIGTAPGLYVLSAGDTVVQPILSADSQLASADIYDIIQDYRGDVWVSSWGNGLYRLRGNPLESPQIHHYTAEDNHPYSLQANRVFSLLEDNDHRLWIGTESRGLHLYVPQIDGFVTYEKDENENTALKSNSVWEIFQDDANRLWVGSYDQGVFLHDDFSSKFNVIRQGHGDNPRLGARTVSSFLEDGNNIWIGTDGGGISVWDRDNNTYRFYNHHPQDSRGLGSDAVLCLFRDSDNTIWVGTWNGGLNRFDSVSNDFETFMPEEGVPSLGGKNVNAIDEDAAGNLWIATWGEGVTRYQKSDGSFLNIKNSEGGDNLLSDNGTCDIEVDDLSGDIWVATFAGLDRISSLNDSTFTSRNYSYGNALESVSGNQITCIFEDTEHRIWVGTNNGLNIFNRQKEIFTKLFKHDGLPGNFIKAVIEDDKGQYWITTEKGLAKLEKSNNGWDITRYDQADGLQAKEFFVNSAYRASSGEILLGGINGFNYFYPDDIQPNPYLPKLQFTGFKLFNEDVTIGGKESPLQSDINATEQIVLRHDQSVFSIEYQGVSFTHPEKNQYAFMLQGFEDDWNYVGNQTMATYTNLDPGKYVFLLKGANNDNIWSATERKISIIILPPWWETWWARLLLFVFISFAILTALHVRLSVIKRQKKILENEVTLRTSEVMSQKREIEQQASLLTKTNEQKNRLFSIISHDLRSPLASLQAITTLLDPEILQKEDLENTRNEISQRINNLSDMMNGLLNWAKQQMEGEKTSPESFDLSTLSQEIVQLYEERAEAKGVSLKRRIMPNSLVYGDLNQARAILRNLVGNAIKFTNQDDAIEILSEPNDSGGMTIMVRDTGVGMDSEKASDLFNIHPESTVGTSGEKGIGLGLILAQEFVEKNGGKIWVESKLGEGSTFYFTLPLGHKASVATIIT